MLGVGILALPPFHLEILAEIESDISTLFVIMVDTWHMVGTSFNINIKNRVIFKCQYGGWE